MIKTPDSVLVNLVVVSLGSYPAAPDSAQPDSGNLHPGPLQPHLYTVNNTNWIITVYNHKSKTKLNFTFNPSIFFAHVAHLTFEEKMCPLQLYISAM